MNCSFAYSRRELETAISRKYKSVSLYTLLVENLVLEITLHVYKGKRKRENKDRKQKKELREKE